MAKCIGCGIKLQTIDKEKNGYAPIIDEDSGTYCMRCYQIIHNGKRYQPNISSNDYYEKIKIIKDKTCLVLLMIDVMDIYGGFIPSLKNYIGNNKVLVLVNKVDLMPKSVHLKKIEETIKTKALEDGLNIAGVMMISAKKMSNIETLISKITRLYENTLKNKKIRYDKMHEVYLLGCASVGKSTLVNAIKQKYTHDEQMLTTSAQFQTTQSFIKISLGNNYFLIDTPGYINKGNYCSHLSYESIKILTPASYLKPKTYQLQSSQTIFLSGLVRLDFEECEKLSVSFYTSNSLLIHRTKMEKANNLFDTQITKMLLPPSEEDLKIMQLTDFKKKTYSLNTGTYDLLISGIGIVHITCEQLKFTVTLLNDIMINLVDAFI